MRLFKENIKVIAKVSLVMILLSFLGLKSKAADKSVVEPVYQEVVAQVIEK